MPALGDLKRVYDAARADPKFWTELDGLLKDYVGRPTPLTDVPRLSAEVKARVLLKREDLNHTGAHKINNTLGQVLLAGRMGKRRIIAETGAGQHGVATATVCARFGLECVVFMGEEDMRRQRLNVYRMELMGAKVVPVTSGTRTLKDATNEALRDWVTNVPTTHYIIGSVVGPDPYPRMVRDFQAVIGREARGQVLDRYGRLPHTVVACAGGGSNAMGIFSGFLEDAAVRLVGGEAPGEGLQSGHHHGTRRRARGPDCAPRLMTGGQPMAEILPASHVGELINGLMKALRAYHMYLPNNPIYQRATENLRVAFLPIWAALDQLVLTVAETDFIWEDQVVYHQSNKAESLAWGLFKDGMRSLTICRNAELD